MALPSILLRFRNRLLSDPKFLAFAQRFPLTRPVARAKSLELFNLLAGFSYSQVLYACVSLRVLEHVGQAGISRVGLAAKTGLSTVKTDLLVDAALALDILGLDKGEIILGSHGAALLGQPWIMRFVEHHKHFYRDLEDPVALLEGKIAPQGLRNYWAYDVHGADKTSYSDLMAASQVAVSEQILGSYKFSKHFNILDVGGGTGAFLRAVGERYPQMHLNLFDLPVVVGLAPPSQNMIVHAGDFRVDALPHGMDLISLIRVVHDHDDHVVLAILRNIRTVCTRETILLIAEPFAGHAATAKVTAAYFNFYFAAMGQGRIRTPAEIAALAAKAGFGHPKVLHTSMPLISGLMTLSPV